MLWYITSIPFLLLAIVLAYLGWTGRKVNLAINDDSGLEKSTLHILQQLLGFFHAKDGKSLKELIQAMEISPKEWEYLMENYSEFFSEESKKLLESNIDELDIS